MMKKLEYYMHKSNEFMKDFINNVPKSTSWLATIFAAIIIALCFAGYLFWLIFVLAAFGCIAMCGLLITFLSKCEEKEDSNGEKQCCCADEKSCKCKHDVKSSNENTEQDFKI